MPQIIPNPPNGKPINKHSAKLESLGWGGYYLASGGTSIAQMATGTSTVGIATAVAAGGAVSATGVGLVVAAGALTIGSTVVNAVAAEKTRKHRSELRTMQANVGGYDCTGFPTGLQTNWVEHTILQDKILPYVIKQKSKKYGRRVRYSIPGVNLCSTIRALGTKVWKWGEGTLGEERKKAARWMVRHLFSHDCELVEAVIAELYSEKEMLWIKYHCEEEVAVPLIAHKLRSI